MWYGVGIDLGTSFTSAAVGHATGTRMVALSPDLVVPSVACPGPDGALLTGTAALTAADNPAKVARNFKRRLGDPTPLVLDGAGYSPAALMAAQLRDVLVSTTQFMGGDVPQQVVLTYPAIWGPYRREHFTEVLRLAGVSEYRLITEPEAAAAHYSAERRLGDGEIVAVYDLGGGTFDTTILRMRSGGMEILGTPEGIEHLGGIDFDHVLLAHVDERLDGAISGLDPDEPANAGFLAEIHASCVQAKEDLSHEPDVTLKLPLPTGTHEVTVTRLELNGMIKPSVELTIDALRRTISAAGIGAGDLSAVLLAGGSSRIPLVSQLVSEEIGKPVWVSLHPKHTVALGAAAIATRHHQPAASRPAGPGPSQPAAHSLAADPGANPAPPPEPRHRGRASRLRRKGLVPTLIAATAVVLAGTVTTLLLTSGGGPEAVGTTGFGATATNGPLPGTASPPAGSRTVAPTSALPPHSIYAAGAVDPYRGFIGDASNWDGTDFGTRGAQLNSISATPGPSGVRVSWTGKTDGQVYLQTPDSTQNLSSYIAADGALAFDVVMHEAPTDWVSLEAHCGYPCAAELPVTTLFQNLPLENKATLKVPLSCFVKDGLDARKVDTPFLVYSDGKLDATFSAIRWEQGAGGDPDAVSCNDLK